MVVSDIDNCMLCYLYFINDWFDSDIFVWQWEFRIYVNNAIGTFKLVSIFDSEKEKLIQLLKLIRIQIFTTN